jgi:hypothetical protein
MDDQKVGNFLLCAVAHLGAAEDKLRDKGSRKNVFRLLFGPPRTRLCDCHFAPVFAQPPSNRMSNILAIVIYYHTAMMPRLSKSDALKLLRQCMQTGIVEYHPHFEKRCRERGVDPQDAQFVLRKGIIYDEPELDVRFREWRYKIEGKPPDSDKLKVVITFLEKDEVLVITVMLDKR